MNLDVCLQNIEKVRKQFAIINRPLDVISCIHVYIHLRFPRYSPDKILKVKVTSARSKVKSMSHHDAAHLQPQTMALPGINFLQHKDRYTFSAVSTI